MQLAATSSSWGGMIRELMPVLAHARSLVMLEQVAGVLYVALVVARIVGLTLTRSIR